MREIKFRAWDKKMGMFIPDFVNRKGCAVGEDENGITIMTKDIMQYTGLKDKQGREIYEGDIFITENEFYGEVKFEDGSFIAYIPPDKKNDYERIDDLNYAVSMGIKIVGNLYENPELLDTK